MKTIQAVKLQNEEINSLAVIYQLSGDEQDFNALMASVKDLAEGVAYKLYNGSKGLNVPQDEFLQNAYIAVYRATETFDAELGGNFTSHVKRYVEWTISDFIIKTNSTQTAKMHKQTLSLDKPLGSGTGTFMDVVEHQFATDSDTVHLSALRGADDTANSPDITAIATDLIKEFGVVASEDDLKIIQATFSTIFTASHYTGDIKRPINKNVQEALGVSSATARKKKGRAFSRFEAFAQEKGFSLDMSQF